MRKVKQSAAENMTTAETACAVPPPPSTVTQALFSPSVYAAEGEIVRIRHALSMEFLGGGALKIRLGAGPPQHGEEVTFHDFSVMGLLPPFLGLLHRNPGGVRVAHAPSSPERDVNSGLLHLRMQGIRRHDAFRGIVSALLCCPPGKIKVDCRRSLLPPQKIGGAPVPEAEAQIPLG